jgi:glycerol-3-phosphate acyltransferase PlsY
MIFWQAGFNPYSIFLTLVCIILLIASVVTIRINGGIKTDLETHGRKVVKIKLVRKIVRLGAIVIPILYLTTSRKVAGWVTGVILLIFIIFEITRSMKPKLHKVRMFKILLKSDEPTRLLSGYTFYLIASFLVIMLFPEGIGGLSLIFLTLGDLFAELVGLNFGRYRTFPGKSLEGSLGCFSICLLSGFIVMIFFDVSLLQVLIGSVVATFVESIPNIEDNLFIAPISSLVMWILS